MVGLCIGCSGGSFILLIVKRKLSFNLLESYLDG